MKEKRILLIDTSSSCSEFGYAEDGRIIREFRDCDRNSADSLAYHIDKFLTENDIHPFSLFAVSLSNGPGSFTGLRIGLSFAKGFCFASGSRLVLVNSLDILAGCASEQEGEFIAAINSNSSSGEFYYSRYLRTGNRLERLEPHSTGLIGELESSGIPVVTEHTLGLDQSLKSAKLASQLRLTEERINSGDYSDLSSAEPYYMKEFFVRK